MEQLSGYEIAQQRIEGRQKQRFRAGIGFAMFFLLIVLTLLAGPQASACLIPLMVCFAFFALIGGIQLYYASPRGAPSAAVVEAEMGWLFGDDWRDIAGTDEFILAQERIRQRRTKRAYFFLHLVIFLLVNAALMPPLLEAVRLMSSGWPRYFLLMFPLVWLGVLGKRASEAFPSRRRLADQEREIGQAILAELERSTPNIEKRKEKPKNDVRYAVGEDGELVEIVDNMEDAGEKPKRIQLN